MNQLLSLDQLETLHFDLFYIYMEDLFNGNSQKMDLGLQFGPSLLKILIIMIMVSKHKCMHFSIPCPNTVCIFFS